MPVFGSMSTFTKFVSLLEKEALFFSERGKLFRSLRGGRIRWVNLELVSEDDRARMQNHAKSAADVIFVNCWHLRRRGVSSPCGDYTSAWDRGIAIRTTVKGLTSSLTCAEDIYIGAVKYIDYGRYTRDRPVKYILAVPDEEEELRIRAGSPSDYHECWPGRCG